MELKEAILNIPDGVQPEGEGDAFCRGFKFGHRTARQQAAGLVAAHDAGKAELLQALTALYRAVMHEATTIKPISEELRAAWTVIEKQTPRVSSPQSEEGGKA